MKVIVVGASGTLGQAVTAVLGEHHEVLEASRRGTFQVDITDAGSIAKLYDATGPVDAVVCTAGVTPFKPLTELSREDFDSGINDKLLGQIELVRQGLDHVRDGGSFTLVSGVTSNDPIATGAVAGTVSGAIDAFVRCAAIELPRGLRINAVSATVFEEAWEGYGEFFPGYRPVPAREVGRAFLKSVSGAQTGQVYRVGY
jgi:NAD(P)-dependent dehydrogenase (short-subunit alcohol dehydrogenase family)